MYKLSEGIINEYQGERLELRRKVEAIVWSAYAHKFLEEVEAVANKYFDLFFSHGYFLDKEDALKIMKKHKII